MVRLLVSVSLAATVQRADQTVWARMVDEEVEEVPDEGATVSSGEQRLAEPQTGPHLLCRFCCQSWQCFVEALWLGVDLVSPELGSLSQP